MSLLDDEVSSDSETWSDYQITSFYKQVEDDEEFSFDDYLMASRYGVWLLVGLFQPKPEEDAR